MRAVQAEIGKAVFGQDRVALELAAALIAGGHVLLQGVPGVAKTLMVKAMAQALDLQFRRVQFTPDLMPSDVTGNVVLDSGSTTLRFRKGPVFTNLLLADELNRTPPKTQAALLEAMEERQVSAEGESHPLPRPFMVVATQNPVEYEGTYPLPEAQLDRFLMQVNVGYPSEADELRVLQMHNAGLDPHDLVSIGIGKVAGAADVQQAAEQARQVTVAPDIVRYIQNLAAETRTSPSIALGVSPRGAAMLLSICKASVWLEGRDFVTPDDVKTSLKPAWRHRLLLRPEVEMEGVRPDSVLEGIAERVTVPR